MMEGKKKPSSGGKEPPPPEVGLGSLREGGFGGEQGRAVQQPVGRENPESKELGSPRCLPGKRSLCRRVQVGRSTLLSRGLGG